MKTLCYWITAWLGMHSLSAWGQLEYVADDIPQAVFAGSPQTIRAVFRNPTDKTLQTSLRTRLYQASSVTLMPVDDAKSWKDLQVLPRQTVLETVTFTFPCVKTGIRFQIHWLATEGRVLGRTDVMVYPEDLLNRLKTLGGEKPLGLLDPDNQLKPILKKLKVEFEDLELGQGLDGFDGRLIIAIFLKKVESPQTMAQKLTARARQGVSIVWIHPAITRAPPAIFLANVIQHGSGALLMAQPSAISHLDVSPLSQLNLLGLAETALNPSSISSPTNP